MSDEVKPNDKELNFRALEARYEKKLAEERAAREEAERKAQEALAARQEEDDDNDDEPYIDKKKLNKTLSKTKQELKKEQKSEVQSAIHQALAEERRQQWLKSNPDFFDVLQHAEKFAMRDPELAETILQMPEGFERQKLVYRNIKAMGLDKPEQKQPSIQEKVDANRRSPYYQPSGISNSPYSTGGDFTPTGQKAAYDKLQELKSRLRI